MRKNKLDSLAFVLYETALYLDGHPNDKRALAYYEDASKQYKAALDDYEKKNGPISHMSGCITSSGKWQWTNGPWPWHNEANERGR